MTNFPTISDIVEQLSMHKKKQSWSNAQVATSLNAFGWNGVWIESHVASLLAGRVKVTDREKEFFERYLLSAFYDANRA